MPRPARLLPLAFVLAALVVPASAAALPAKHGGGGSHGCEVEAEGSLPGKGSFELDAELRHGKLEGDLELKDKKLSFRATRVTALVVAGEAASVQGSGKSRGATHQFSASIDAAAGTFAVRLSNGYSAAGSFDGRHDDLELDGSCPFDGQATLVTDPARTVSAAIGSDGGSLSTGNITLSIPAGALSDEKTITLTPLLDLGGSPLALSVVGAAKLAPEGLRFLKPAQLSISFPAGLAPADIIGFGSAGDGTELHLQPRTIAAGIVTLELWHFSTAGASSGGAGAAAAVQSHTPSTAEAAALQRIAAATGPCEAELTSGVFNGPACLFLRQEQVGALRDWYTNAVKPQLDQAVGAPATDVEQAMAEWLHWKAKVEATLNDLTDLCGELATQCSAAEVAATKAVQALATRRLQSCDGTALLSQLRDVARVADFVNAGAIDLTANNSGLPEVNGLLRRCAHLEIEVTEFPAVAALLYANTLRGRVTVDVNTGPDRTDVPFTFTVDGRAVPTAADGSFDTTVTTTTAPLNVPLTAIATDTALQNNNFTGSELLTKPARDRLQLQAFGSTAVAPGGSVSLRVLVAGDGMAGAAVATTLVGGGSLSAGSVTTNSSGEANLAYTAPTTCGSGVVTATLSPALGSTSGSITLTTQASVSGVTISPPSATVAAGGTMQFGATVTGGCTQGVTWTATGGTVDATGLYTAGSTPGSYTVTARSTEDPTQTASATVTIGAGGQVTVLERHSSAIAGCHAEHMLPTDCLGPDGFLATLGSFAFTATESVTGTIEDAEFYPGFEEHAAASSSQESRVFINALFPLQLHFSGAIGATAAAHAGISEDGGSVARAGAGAGGGSQFEVDFEVTGAPMSFMLLGTAAVSGSGCVNVVLDRAGPGVEFEADFCAGEPPEELDDEGTLAPGRYQLSVGISANAVMNSDMNVPGELVTDGVPAGSATADIDLIVQ